MKQIFIVLFFILFFFDSADAQKNSSGIFLAFSTGPTFPISKFADKTFSGTPGDSAGLAKTGIGADLSFTYRLNKHFGGVLVVGGSFNKQDETSYENYSRQFYGSNSRVEASTNSWKILKIMAGANFVAPLSNASKLHFQSQVAAGVCKTAVPGYAISVYSQSGSFISSMNRSKTPLPFTFCYQINAGLQYPLNSNIDIILSIDCFNSTPTKEYSYNPNFPLPGPTISEKKEYSLASLSTNAGITIKL